jgi:ElaB/YqjD/DUF883 family membrane-anchored ribosome-binding protein
MNNGKNKEDWSEAIDRARDHFNDGWKELGAAAELAKERGEDVWAQAQKKGKEAWVNARALGMEKWEDAKEKGSEALERGEEIFDEAGRLFRKSPVKAVGLTLLVGAFIGLLISRDRD